jgi:hypothetical protein
MPIASANKSTPAPKAVGLLLGAVAALLVVVPVAAAQLHARTLRPPAAKRAIRKEALHASEFALGSVLTEGRGNALIAVGPCRRRSARRIGCRWRAHGIVEQSDGYRVPYRCRGKGMATLRHSVSAEATFDCTFRARAQAAATRGDVR